MADDFYSNLDKEAGITYDVPATMAPSDNFYEDLDREADMPPVKRKTFKQAISHGLERVDIASLKALGGLAKLEAEVGGDYRTKLWRMAGLETPVPSQLIKSGDTASSCHLVSLSRVGGTVAVGGVLPLLLFANDS